MGISNEQARRFAKQTVDKSKDTSGKTVTGTAVKYNGSMYVQIDGSDQLTPIISSTVGMRDGDRVTVLIKDHTTTVTGNTSAPSVNQGDLEESHKDLVDQITEVEILVADKASIKDLEAESARIDDLVADNVTIKGQLTATDAEIKNLKAENVEISGQLTAQDAEIENLKVTKLDVDIADIKYATIEKLEATDANIHNLEADYGEFKQLSTDHFAANDAEIKRLDAEKASIKDLDAKYANIDFANIGSAAIENFFSKSGMIGDLVVGEGTITGTLVGVTIKGDLIEGGTVVADKLVLKGEDGLYYKLNTNGETIGAQQTDYNSLNGSIITAKSITAEKVNVNDLVAFGATIGGFHITEDALYSGVKSSVNNTTRGTYMDDDGQFAIGDGSNYLKFFKDTDGKYKLDISAASIKMGSSSLDQYVDDKVNSAVEDLDIDVEVGGRNLLIGTNLGDKHWRFATGDGAGSKTAKIFTDLRNVNGVRFDITKTSTNWNYLAFYDAVFADLMSSTPSEKYTISFDIKSDMASEIEVYVSDGTGLNMLISFSKVRLVKDEWKHYSYTSTSISKPVNSDQQVIFNTFNANKAGATYFEIANLKIEKGNTPTDWTPAPEDVQQDITDAQNSANDANNKYDSIAPTVEFSKSQIEILNKSIQSLVVDQDGGSLMTQTPDGWSFNIGDIQTGINNALDGVDKVEGDITGIKELADETKQIADDLKAKTAYINMTQDSNGQPVLELGQKDGEFRLRITNTSMDFMQGQQRIAYLSNRQLYIQSSVVTDEMKIGAGAGYIWKKRANGNMGLRYVTGG